MDNKAFLQKYAMRFGTFMGIFWIGKFFLFPLGLEIAILQYVFIALCIYVPFLGYRFAKKYRDDVCCGEISFVHAWVFVTFMYLFASLFTSVGHYIYFQFIDYGYIANTYLLILQESSKVGAPEWKEIIKQMNEAVSVFSSLSPIQIVMHLLSQNMLYCSIISIPTALILKREFAKPYDKDKNIEDNKE